MEKLPKVPFGTIWVIQFVLLPSLDLLPVLFELLDIPLSVKVTEIGKSEAPGKLFSGKCPMRLLCLPYSGMGVWDELFQYMNYY